MCYTITLKHRTQPCRHLLFSCTTLFRSEPYDKWGGHTHQRHGADARAEWRDREHAARQSGHADHSQLQHTEWKAGNAYVRTAVTDEARILASAAATHNVGVTNNCRPRQR